MNDWVKQSVTYNKIIISLFIGLLSFLALQIYSKVDAMPGKFVGIERYLNDQLVTRNRYIQDMGRMEKAINEIQKDVKEILRRSREPY
uniref:Uncharacterized protein n=1 Tax=viral metagenome TaxID=1070528 RepID=A0A6M3JK38_9ZZZZ